MSLSNKTKKKIQHEKELNSLRNKMGSNIVWFDSLSKTKQYDLLYAWKQEKSRNKLTKPLVRKVRRRVLINNRFVMKLVDVISYPPSLKHFIIKSKSLPGFAPSKVNLRQSAIDLILNK